MYIFYYFFYTGFVGLRAKMYAIKFADNKVVKKAKGVKKNVIEKRITFENYLECLLNNCTITEKQNLIKAHLHRVFTIEQNKKVLDGKDDKRFQVDGIRTLAWGNVEIKQILEERQKENQQ